MSQTVQSNHPPHVNSNHTVVFFYLFSLISKTLISYLLLYRGCEIS